MGFVVVVLMTYLQNHDIIIRFWLMPFNRTRRHNEIEKEVKRDGEGAREREGRGGRGKKMICSNQLNHIPQNCTRHVIMVVWLTVFTIMKLMLGKFDVEVTD